MRNTSGDYQKGNWLAFSYAMSDGSRAWDIMNTAHPDSMDGRPEDYTVAHAVDMTAAIAIIDCLAANTVD